MLAAASKLLNLAPNELRAQLREGKSLAEVAEAQGVAKQALIDALVRDFTERVERLEERGAIGPERAERLLQNLPERVAKMVERKKP